jgi:hypothetical protein
MPDTFSQRHGLAGPLLGTLLRDEVPPSFRMFLLDLGHEGQFEYCEIQKVVCKVLQVWPAQSNCYHGCRKHIQDCDWFFIYDIIEGLYKYLYEKNSRSFSGATTRFTEAINKALVEQNIGWQLVNGKIVVRGDETFEETIKTAVSVLGQNDKPTAADHLKSAIRALSERPKTNTTGTVSHATNAVECVLGDLTGEALTLGKYLDRYPMLFHPALKKALDGVYGYASDAGARHGKEGVEPSPEEARFAVAICAAVCTLLTNQPPER